MIDTMSEPIPAITRLREILSTNNDEALIGFLHSWATGFAADQFISTMATPGQRVEFLVAIGKTYREDMKEAFKQLYASGDW
jgi:hypothetical protein